MSATKEHCLKKV